MKTYLIGYDLNKSDKDYNSLIEKIKTYGTWWHNLDSTWIIKTNQSATQIKNTLAPLIDNNDELLVMHLSGEFDSAGFKQKETEWLQQQMPNT